MEYETPAATDSRGRDICNCTVNVRKYDCIKWQFNTGVFEEMGVESRVAHIYRGYSCPALREDNIEAVILWLRLVEYPLSLKFWTQGDKIDVKPFVQIHLFGHTYLNNCTKKTKRRNGKYRKQLKLISQHSPYFHIIFYVTQFQYKFHFIWLQHSIPSVLFLSDWDSQGLNCNWWNERRASSFKVIKLILIHLDDWLGAPTDKNLCPPYNFAFGLGPNAFQQHR